MILFIFFLTESLDSASPESILVNVSLFSGVNSFISESFLRATALSLSISLVLIFCVLETSARSFSSTTTGFDFGEETSTLPSMQLTDDDFFSCETKNVVPRITPVQVVVLFL